MALYGNVQTARSGAAVAKADPLRKAQRNRVLSALPEQELEGLLPELEPIEFELKDSFYEVDRPIEHVFFVLTGVASLVSVMDDGAIVEVATVGNEGMVGLPVFLGADKSPLRAFMQVPGDVLRLTSKRFKEEIVNGRGLTKTLHRYTQALFNQIARSAACNRVHSIEERCARWLLMTHDRVGADEFPLTHEFLSQMLGVRRASVSVAAGALQRDGLIRYNRGRILVTDREGLERASCECYSIIEREYDRLLGGVRRARSTRKPRKR